MPSAYRADNARELLRSLLQRLVPCDPAYLAVNHPHQSRCPLPQAVAPRGEPSYETCLSTDLLLAASRGFRPVNGCLAIAVQAVESSPVIDPRDLPQATQPSSLTALRCAPGLHRMRPARCGDH